MKEEVAVRRLVPAPKVPWRTLRIAMPGAMADGARANARRMQRHFMRTLGLPKRRCRLSHLSLQRRYCLYILVYQGDKPTPADRALWKKAEEAALAIGVDDDAAEDVVR